MHHVGEIDMVRNVVDPDPRDWLLFIPVIHQLFDFRGVLGNEQMAGSTVRHSGYAGDRRFWSRAVTVKARDTVVAGMHLMTEGERLDRRTLPKIQRQIVHQCQAGDESAGRNDQPANKPRYFHDVCQGESGKNDEQDYTRSNGMIIADIFTTVKPARSLKIY